ncbi:tetratricopeptide repeat protein [Streptomyces afghaniensis]|uniref:tetratricopeptide repeat protein n=1 Tax=Streptomyces afghaniensis TaxID=66865 RepID=UPI002780157A|nr:hypothetical protein [Streptomyces afghaniensis]MDQ1019954.1 TPR repeat protein [Streptomyces afghaniensis]
MKRDGVRAVSGRAGRSGGSSRLIPRPLVPPGPLRELKDLLYEVYLSAGAPTLDAMAEMFADLDAEDEQIKAAPSRDTVQRMIASSDLPARQADVVALVVLLSRQAGGEAEQAGRDAGRLWMQARLQRPLGRPIHECDPFELEVHRSIGADSHDVPLPPLPAYIKRDHDRQLQRAVADVVDGASRIVMLVGSSSTGKTRACWEAVCLLPAGWRLWHPIDPDRADAAQHDLPRVGPRTVVWLNEAQHYLSSPVHGESVAAGLRTLLSDPSRAPVLVLGTIWPEYHAQLTRSPAPGGPDPHAQVRALLAGRTLHVPTCFEASAAVDLASSADPRLLQAAASAADGMITQFLAGAPALLDRYEHATAGSRALLEAAIDARRLGHGPDLLMPFLADAAEAYLSDTEWDLLPENWVETCLEELTTPIRGARGALHRRRRPRGTGRASADDAPLYRLADYLEQVGRRRRRLVRIPELFWQSVMRHCRGADTEALGEAAWSRGLLRTACEIWIRGRCEGRAAEALADVGRIDEALTLYSVSAERGAHEAWLRGASLLAAVDWHTYWHGFWDGRPRRLQEALHWFEQAAECGNPSALRDAGEHLADVDELDRALEWFGRAAEEGDSSALLRAADRLASAGRFSEAFQWFERAFERGSLDGLVRAGSVLGEAGWPRVAQRWFVRAARSGHRDALVRAAECLADSGMLEAALDLFDQVGNGCALRRAGDHLFGAGRPEEALEWYRRAADRGDIDALSCGAFVLMSSDRTEEALQWYQEAAARGDEGALVSAAQQLATHRDLSRALEWFQSAFDHGATDALRGAADHLVAAGRLEDALEWYERAAEHGQADALTVAAAHLAATGQLDRALEWFDRATQQGDTIAHRSAGDYLSAAGRQAEAETRYARVVEAGFADVLLANAERLAWKGTVDEAMHWYEQAAVAGVSNVQLYAATMLRAAGQDARAVCLQQYGWSPNGNEATPWQVDEILADL